ncbi:MAG: proline--tRNA ligase [Candidatus Shapirobacteria bacterium]|nr:proline--tRNA ligase [Candidatus Shapirobacteria bacterium]MDD4410745.1 proline--tRNA ligase [Candidatus Shapirobacteria bacterium]
MTKKFIKLKSEDLSEWYNDLVVKAELADYAPVKGCMVIRPYGYAIWERIQSFMDKFIKEKGVQNAYFPLFIPESFLKKEKEHVAGFAPELAIVTIGGGQELTEKLIVRPTSETIMYEMYKKWTQSWRDLPVMMNQWCNVVRWEQRTYLFLRTTEFLWQEGHCAHATDQENQEMVQWALNLYKKTYSDLLAMYGVTGIKSETEKFGGASKTYTIEVLMPNGKALQAGTSHDLGQNFAKSFDWSLQDQNGDKLYPYQNSWGLSTRSIGGLIMVHGDDNGLVFPPQIAPTQLVIVPIPGHEKAIKLANSIFDQLKSKYRSQIDDLAGETAGFKFNKWEMKGVPIRLEIGDKEADIDSAVVVRRDTLEKQTVKIADLEKTIDQLLIDIQSNLLEKHQKFTQDNTFSVDSYDEFKKIMSTTRGFISAHWCESADCEAKIKEETKATTRCLPDGQKDEAGVCIHCGQPSKHRWLFAQSY